MKVTWVLSVYPLEPQQQDDDDAEAGLRGQPPVLSTHSGSHFNCRVSPPPPERIKRISCQKPWGRRPVIPGWLLSSVWGEINHREHSFPRPCVHPCGLRSEPHTSAKRESYDNFLCGAFQSKCPNASGRLWKCSSWTSMESRLRMCKSADYKQRVCRHLAKTFMYLTTYFLLSQLSNAVSNS